MLNRLFVVIGVLVILVIGAAFIAPYFVPWENYRGRLEGMAAEVFGTDVAITGDIHLTLLPQPQLVFTQVKAGPAKAPVLQIGRVEAEFSLLDFLQDHYKLTRLELDQPSGTAEVGDDGRVHAGVSLTPNARKSSVSVANAEIVDGRLAVTDTRSGQVWNADGINGQIRLDALQGPFSFDGRGRFEGNSYGTRIAAGKLDASGNSVLTVSVVRAGGGFKLDTNGVLQTKGLPRYSGDMTFSVSPPKPTTASTTADAGQGDFTVATKFDATSERILLPGFTATPDENRPASKLTGALELTLGKSPKFNAIVSGGTVALPPPDATVATGSYEFVRLLSNIPFPPVPPVPGTLGLDLSEVDLNSVTLRDIRVDAATDGTGWLVKQLKATLPGETVANFNGTITGIGTTPDISGELDVSTEHLDQLAQLWRRADTTAPLANLIGSAKADVLLTGDRLQFANGELTLADVTQPFDVDIGFGVSPQLRLSANFATLDVQTSAAIAALVPDVAADPSFGLSFPRGQVRLSADRADVLGFTGSGLVANASWDAGVVQFSKLAATDLGGAAFDLKLTAFGTLQKPQISGSGTVKVTSADSPAFATMVTNLGASQQLQAYLKQSLPAALTVTLDPPKAEGGQDLHLAGKLGVADAKLEAQLGEGISNAFGGSAKATLDLSSDDADRLTAQLGLGDISLFPLDPPLHLSLALQGDPNDGYATKLMFGTESDHIVFDGKVRADDPTKPVGSGQLEAKLTDPGPLLHLLGTSGLYVPGISGTASVKFMGLDQVTLTDLAADLPTGKATGELTMLKRGDVNQVTGSLDMPSMDARGLVPVLTGPSGTIAGKGFWPDGPIDIGTAARTTEGRVNIHTAKLDVGQAEPVADARFGIDWDAQSIHLRDLNGKYAGGAVTLDASICCSVGNLPQKQLSGRLALDRVSLDALAPGGTQQALDGTVTLAAQFAGTGPTLAQQIAGLTGTGSFSVDQLRIADFDPATFEAAGRLTNVDTATPDAIGNELQASLKQGAFVSPDVTGSFSISGGVVRSSSLAIESDAARLFGSGTLGLADGALSGHYTLTPKTPPDDASALDPTTAEVDATVGGTLSNPTAQADFGTLIGGMKIKANEVELARLEQLKQEDDARQQVEAAERARVQAQVAATQAAKDASSSSAQGGVAAQGSSEGIDD